MEIGDEYVEIEDGGLLKHGRFFIPKNAKSLIFKHRGNGNLKSGSIAIDFYDIENNIIYTPELIHISNDYLSFVTETILLDNILKDNVVSFSFFFKGKTFDPNKGKAGLIIDEVKLSENGFKKTNSVPEGIINEFVEKEERVLEINSPIGISNETFENLIGWEFSGGEVGIERESAFLRPIKKKQPVILKHTSFRVPENTQNLSFRLHTDKLIKADIKVQINDLQTRETEIIHTEKIRISFLDKVDARIDEIDEAIENLEFDGFKKKFKEVKFNVRKYRGKLITLEFIYNSIGNGKPKMYVDDVIIE